MSAEVQLDWRVVETANMVKVANHALSNAELSFFHKLSDAQNNTDVIDLVFASSSLQYCENPLSSLVDLAKIGAKYLFITRTPFADADKTYITTQQSNLGDNGPGPLPEGFVDSVVSVPITFIPISKVEEILKKRYKIKFKLNEQDGYFSVHGEIVNTQFGYFCELIEPDSALNNE